MDVFRFILTFLYRNIVLKHIYQVFTSVDNIINDIYTDSPNHLSKISAFQVEPLPKCRCATESVQG